MDTFITFSASYLIWFMFAGLFILWVIDGKIKKEQVLHALVSAIVAWALSEMIKSLFPTLRPFRVNGDLPLTAVTPTNSAFPSAHTAVAIALGVTIWLHDRKVGFPFLVLGIIVGVARVLGNVHYPLDILGGAFVGSVVAIVVENLHPANLLSRRKNKNP